MRNGRPYAIKIAPAAVIAFAALAVGYGLGEQAQLGERDVQTVTQGGAADRRRQTPVHDRQDRRAHRRHKLRAHRPAERRRQ